MRKSIIKSVTGTAASIDKIGWQTEYLKSKYISNQTNEPLLQEKKGWMKNSTKRYWTSTKAVSKSTIYDLIQTRDSTMNKTLLSTIIKKMITLNGDRKVYQEIIQDIKPRCCVT